MIYRQLALPGRWPRPVMGVKRSRIKRSRQVAVQLCFQFEPRKARKVKPLDTLLVSRAKRGDKDARDTLFLEALKVFRIASRVNHRNDIDRDAWEVESVHSIIESGLVRRNFSGGLEDWQRYVRRATARRDQMYFRSQNSQRATQDRAAQALSVGLALHPVRDRGYDEVDERLSRWL